MTRAFKCSFSTTGKFEPIPLCSSRRARAQNGGKMAGRRFYRAEKRKITRKGLSHLKKTSRFLSYPPPLAPPLGGGPAFSPTYNHRAFRPCPPAPPRPRR